MDVRKMASAGDSTWSFFRGTGKALVMVLVGSLCVGCVVTEQSRTGDRETSGAKLMKPYIPEERDPAPSGTTPPSQEPLSTLPAEVSPAPPIDTSRTRPADVSPTPVQPAPPPKSPMGTDMVKPRRGVPSSPEQSERADWEDQKVRRGAMQMLRQYPTVKKVKICYAVKDDEWWVILYEDLDTHYELRQFTWDRDQSRLRPFLVLKRIHKNQLQEHLTASEPDRACEVLDPVPPRAGTAETPLDF
ncbi:MAG: hypothetical protein RDU20_01220 [Desulfomonilaceae bacterium]|nr:hypothetical protein [Desulfomonilaceae bacterium]